MTSTRLYSALAPPIKAIGLAAWTTSLLSVAHFHTSLQAKDKQEALFDTYVRHWAQGVLTLMRAKIYCPNKPATPTARARLVVANHRSAADITVLLKLFGGSILSRADLATWPLIGRAARSAQTIFVDRHDNASKMQAIREIRHFLSRGRTVTIFPEGGTHEGDEVRPFAAGSLAALRGLDVEIIPVGLAYPPGSEFLQDSFSDHAREISLRCQLPIGVAIGEALLPASNASGQPIKSAALAERLRDSVQGLVIEARRLVPHEGTTNR